MAMLDGDFFVGMYAEEYAFKLPTYANKGDAGADLYAAHDAVILPGGRVLVSTGIHFQIPEGYVGLVHPRSGLANKHGITVLNTPGTIDSGYRGEVKILLLNTDSVIKDVRRGDRVAQILFQRVDRALFARVSKAEWDSLEESERGTGGFGSTGQ